MLDCVADGHAESEKEDLATREEGGAEHDVTDGPSVFQCAEDQNQLGDNIDWHTDDWPDDVDDEEGDGFCVVEAEELLEGGNCDETGNEEYDEAGDAKGPKG